MHVQLATTAEFLRRVFVPKAAANGAEVEATIIRSDPDSSPAIGKVRDLPNSQEHAAAHAP